MRYSEPVELKRDTPAILIPAGTPTILPKGTAALRRAIVSVPKDDEKHPRRIVMNAFLRRGVGVRKTQGTRYRFHRNMPARKDEGAAQPFEFFDMVEQYD